VPKLADWGIDNLGYWYIITTEARQSEKAKTMSKRTPLQATRVTLGHYRWGAYIIERMYDWDTCKPDGRWTWRHEEGYPNDYYWSKREALEALNEFIITSNAEK